MKAFLADQSPDAYEKLIDRLLASPRYGEHWARYWLDAAGYADSEGGKMTTDDPRQPTITVPVQGIMQARTPVNPPPAALN